LQSQQTIKSIISENKDIILDLNGNTVSAYGTIEVIGNLEIMDVTNEGKIENHTAAKTIENEGAGRVNISRRNG